MNAELGTPEHAAEVTAGRHPATADALQWLCFAQLPANLQDYSRPAYQTAVEWILANTDSPELTKALNALTEAKNWAVMAGIRTTTGRAGPVARPREVVNPPQFATHERGLVTGPATEPTGITAREGWHRPVRDNPQA